MGGNKSAENAGVFSKSQLDAHGESHNAAAINGWKRAGVRPLAVAAVVVILAMMVAPALAVDNWAWVSKGPVGTDAMSLSCSSSQAGVVFAGTNGGVYKTSDYGDNWSYSGIRFRSIDALGESSGCNLGLIAGASGDLFQSLGGGSTWNILAPIGKDITAVLVTNSPACTGYVGTSNGVLATNGPGLEGMEIKALAVDSNNNVYAATVGNGIYKTTDGGNTWVPKGLASTEIPIFPFQGLSSLTNTPASGALDLNISLIDGDTTASAGINIGPPPLGGDTRPRNIGLEFITATELNKLFVWINRDQLPDSLAGCYSWAVYTSSDNLNWQLQLPAAPFIQLQSHFEISFQNVTARYIKVVVNPLTPVCAASAPTFPDPANIFITEIQAFLNKPASEVFSLIIDSSNRIFAGTLGGGVFLSTDGGDNWMPKNNGLPIFDGNPGFYVAYSLAKDSLGNLYAGMVTDVPLAGSVYKSINNGGNWTKTGDSIDSYFPESMCVTPDNKLFVGTTSGVFRTDDAGSTWTDQENKISAMPFNNTFIADLGGTVFIGSDGSGVYKSTDNGETWAEAGTGSPRSVEALVIDGSDYLYALDTDISGVYKSEDNGDTWTLSSTGLPTDSLFYIEGKSLGTLGTDIYIGLDNGRVYKTTDQAENWYATAELPFTGGISKSIVALVGSTPIVLAGTDGDGIFKTEDWGATWVQKNSGLPANARIIQNSFFRDETSGYIFVGLQSGGLYRSVDGGDSWGQVSMPGVTGCEVRSVTREDVSGFLYAVVCSGAVFQSTDDGDNWTPFLNNGLKPWDNVSGIHVTGIFAHNGFFVATKSSGMYKFSKDLAIIEGAPDVYYSSLQDAYNSAQSEDSIRALAVLFYSEDLFFDDPGKSVVLRGGYGAGFVTNPDATSVAGALTVSQGTVVLQNMIVGSLTISGQGTVYAENVVVR